MQYVSLGCPVSAYAMSPWEMLFVLVQLPCVSSSCYGGPCPRGRACVLSPSLAPQGLSQTISIPALWGRLMLQHGHKVIQWRPDLNCVPTTNTFLALFGKEITAQLLSQRYIVWKPIAKKKPLFKVFPNSAQRGVWRTCISFTKLRTIRTFRLSEGINFFISHFATLMKICRFTFW
jgi:hypothetical protein